MIQPLAHTHEKAVDDGLGTWTPATHVEDLDFRLDQPWQLRMENLFLAPPLPPPAILFLK